ncbi:MAG: iron-sulfur cluster-binding domain-containing protein [Bacteroidota bacterium]|nr:iron-sulfur cluster-binding domain-containing protein [Bacteroidota bacterium]
MPLATSSNLYSTLIIEAIKEEATGFKTFVFAEGHKIQYEAGQFLTLAYNIDGEEVRRSYSITSSPVLGEPLTIGVKRIDNGVFSRMLVDRVQIGDAILTTGAGGFFRLPDDINSFNTIFFFAAGSGITPVFSLLKTVLHLNPQMNVYLIYSNHSVATTIFYQELIALRERYKTILTIAFLFSTTADLRNAHLNRDLLEKLLLKHKHNLQKSLFYTCGPEVYMRMVIYILQEAGVPKMNIKKEDFIPVKSAITRLLPPDTGAHLVTLQFKDATYFLAVAFPDTILTAAKKEKIALPYSCETGKCGNCAARCLAGEVWLSSNEVLTEKELAQGLTLTCVGHPVNGDVVLQFSPI